MTLLLIITQAAAIAAAPAPAAKGQEGVVSYPLAFFAAQQPSNASEMVSRIPGFTLDQGDSVRGFEGAAGNVLIDGRRPTSKTDNLESILQRIPASQVERIDVIRGGAPGIDMQGKSVLANVIKKPGGGFRGLYLVKNNHLSDGRDLHGMRVEVSGETGQRSWEASARYDYGADDGGDNGPQVRLDPSGKVIRNSYISGRNDGVNGSLFGAYEQPLLGGQVRVNGRWFSEKWKTVQDNLYSNPASLGLGAEDDVSHTTQTELGLRFNRDLNSRTALEVIGLRQAKDRELVANYAEPGAVNRFDLAREGSETIGRAVLKYRFNDQISVETGGETAVNKLDSKTRLAFNGAARTLPAAAVQIEEKRSELFLKGSWRPNPSWTVDGGVRYEFSEIASSGDVVLSKELRFAKPRLQVTWQAFPATQFRFRYERVVGQLNFDDFVASSNFNTGQGVSAGNPDLNPEQAWVSEAAIEQRFWGGAVIVLTARHSALTDAVDRGPVRQVRKDPATGADIVEFFDQPINIGDGTKDELNASLTLPFDKFGWKGALLKAEYNYRRSEVTDPTTRTKREISGLRPVEWKINFAQDLPRWKTTVGLDLYPGWEQTFYRYNVVETVKLHNSYVHPFVDVRLAPNLVVRLEVGNLTSRGIRIIDRVYAAPRSATNLLYIDDRNLKQGPSYFVRFRKTFGG